MTPEERVLRALDELRDAMGAVLAQRREPAELPALLTLTDTARRLGVSRSTATRWADDGRLRTVGGPKARRVPRSAIAEYVNGKAGPDRDSA
jgi:excisionase family DNA binding protein